jgi:hypothetical protein
MQIVVPRWPVRTLLTPAEIAGLAAWYDVSDASTLRIDGSNRVSLVADKSGNSAVNCLCLNGVSGNYASTPDAAPLRLSTALDISAEIALDDWTSGTYIILCKEANAGARSYRFWFLNGQLRLLLSADGSAATIDIGSSANVSAIAYSRLFVRVTWSAASGVAQFFTSTNGTTWTQLGTDVAAVLASIFNSSSAVEIGSRFGGATNPFLGRIYSARVSGTIGGSAVLNANFATAGKLVSSFTESSSNAATVTINSSGDLGARISGERDLVQLTAAKQPIYTAASGGVGAYLTFDGTDDYMKAASFSLSQPESVYFVGQQVSWTANDRIYCGNTDTTTQLEQIISSPQVFLRSSSGTNIISSWAIGTTAIITAIYNSTSSFLRRNRDTAVGPSTNNTVGNGFTLGAQASGIDPSNIRFNEAIIRSAADATAVQDRFILRAGQKWGFSV